MRLAGGGGPSSAQVAADLQGSPPALAALHRQAGTRSSPAASRRSARALRALRGYPVVVMQWASWCDGCADDLRYFRTALRAARQTGRVHRRRRRRQRLPRPGTASTRRRSSFPSYADHDRAIAATLSTEWSQYTPVTFFYTRSGEQESSAGPFLSEHTLRQAIRRYTGV